MDRRTDRLTGEPVVVVGDRQDRPNLPAPARGLPVLPRRPRGARALRRALVPQPVAVAPRRPGRGGALLARPRRRAVVARRRRVRRRWSTCGPSARPRLGARDDVAYVLVFENRGAEVGATIAHPHGQIYAFDRRAAGAPAPSSTAGALPALRRSRDGTGVVDGIAAAGGPWVPFAAVVAVRAAPRPGRARARPARRSTTPARDDLAACWSTCSAASTGCSTRRCPTCLVPPAAHRRRRLAGGPRPRPRGARCCGPPGTPRFVAAGELGSGVFFNPVEPDGGRRRACAMPERAREGRAFAPGRVNLIGDHTDYDRRPRPARWPSTSAPPSPVERRRRRGAARARPTEAEPAVVPLDVADPAGRSSRRGPATSPAWWPRSRPPTACDGHGHHHAARRRRAVVERRARGGGGPGPRLRRLAARAGPGVPAGRAAGVGRAVRDHGPAGVGRRGRRATPCCIDCTHRRASRRCRCPTTSRWSPSHSGRGARRWPAPPTPSGARRARPRRPRSVRSATPTLDDVATIGDAVVRRRARHVVTENERVRDVGRRAARRRPGRRSGRHGRQPRSPARRLRGVDPRARPARRPARRRPPASSAPASPAPASAAAPWPCARRARASGWWPSSAAGC